jgi:sugar lactone lactonase YvrE
MRLNDGRVDRQGRFWTGAMVENDAQAPPERGSLYRFDPPGTAAPEAMRDGISISNSICFSPDGFAFASGAEDGYVHYHRLPPEYFSKRFE